MWSVVPSFEPILQALSVVFTQPSYQTNWQIFVGWLMCLGRRTEFRVFEAFRGKHVARKKRHPFDREYNFFSRTAWSVVELARHVAVNLVNALNPERELMLIVDATLLHKRGQHVWALGWFYDPAISTKKRSVIASGNKWVVLGLAVRVPLTNRYLCLPIHAMLQIQGEGQPSEADLARRMIEEVAQWFPDRRLLLIGDGAYSAKNLVRDLNARVRYVGLMRKDAELHEPLDAVPLRGGRYRRRGPRLPAPHEIAKLADRAKTPSSRWRWTTIWVWAYGQKRRFQVVAFQAIWRKVFGPRPIQVVVVRSLDKGYGDAYHFTTDLMASAAWVVETYAKRTWIEAMFKNSKQVMDIQRPRHFCRQSVEKLAPWVWFMQSLVGLWYLTEGHKEPQAREARKDLGPWETEWSLQHMLRVLRRLTVQQTIEQMSHTKANMQQMIDQLENYVFLAA
jgi:DDE superfamily endonuclease